MLATGTTATRDESVEFDGRRILTSDDAVTLDRLPRTLVVIGAGVIGLEYASMFSALGVRVTLVDKRPRLLSYMDSEIMDALAFHMRRGRMTLWLGEEVSALELDDGHDGAVRVHLASGKHIVAEKAFYSIGRTGATREPQPLRGGDRPRRPRPADRGRALPHRGARTSTRSAT